MKRYVIYIIFILCLILAAVGMYTKNNILPSALVGKKFPEFQLTELLTGETVNNQKLANDISLINIWASWCVACRDEHATLLQLKENNKLSIYGINYQDDVNSARRWLYQYHNPYNMTLVDSNGTLGMELGVYGLPETYVLDKNKRIRYKIVGALTPDIVKDRLLPVIAEIKSNG